MSTYQETLANCSLNSPYDCSSILFLVLTSTGVYIMHGITWKVGGGGNEKFDEGGKKMNFS